MRGNERIQRRAMSVPGKHASGQIAVAQHVRRAPHLERPPGALDQFRHPFRSPDRGGLLDIALTAPLMLQSLGLKMIGTDNEITIRLAHLRFFGRFLNHNEFSIRAASHEPKRRDEDFGAAQDAERFGQVVRLLHNLAPNDSSRRRGLSRQTRGRSVDGH